MNRFYRVLTMSAWAVNPETITITAINTVYVKWVSALFSDTSIHNLAHIPHHSQCKNMYALGLRETKFLSSQ
jgi:hypothetical protein